MLSDRGEFEQRGRTYLAQRLAAIDERVCSSRSRFLRATANDVARKMYGIGNGVALFGSQVTGFATHDSDYDMFIVNDRFLTAKHEFRIVRGMRCDVHVCSLKYLLAKITQEASRHQCFYVRSLSESFVVNPTQHVRSLRSFSRKLYINPPPYRNWGQIKVNLFSKMDDLNKARGRMGRNVYIGELVTYIMQCICIVAFGWVATRTDVLIKWLQGAVPNDFGILESCYNAALGKNVKLMRDLCMEVGALCCESPRYGDAISVSDDGQVAVLAEGM